MLFGLEFRALQREIHSQVEVRKLLPLTGSPDGREDVCLISLAIPDLDLELLDWLKAQEGITKFYWKSPSQGLEAAGLGELFSIQSAQGSEQVFSTIESLLANHPQGEMFRFFGGACFVEPKDQETTAPFSTTTFYQPEIVVLRSSLGCRLILAFRYEDELSEAEITSKLCTKLEGALKRYSGREILVYKSKLNGQKLLIRSDRPSKKNWRDAVESALSQFAEAKLTKVVLARETELEFSSPVAALDLLATVIRKNPRNYAFHLELAEASALEGSSFTCLSPECLFKISGSSIASDALGGTFFSEHRADDQRPELSQGEDSQEAAAEQEKLLEEHSFVVDHLAAVYAELCSNYTSDASPRILGQYGLSHLQTRFSGELKERVGLREAFFGIHPTPAVCGTPTAQALEFLAKNEPFSRGWYSGAVGFISRELSELAVGIRSCVCSDRKVSLYAGAGITAGSKPDREWQELEAKIAALLSNLAPSEALPVREEVKASGEIEQKMQLSR